MNQNIRKRIDGLKKKADCKTDADLLKKIYAYKKSRGEVGIMSESSYIERNKGSFSQCINGIRKFKLEDYLAIEYVLNTSMTYIIEGRGETSVDFVPRGLRYAAVTDTVGNYETLIQDDIIRGSDEYDKTLIDYMIEYKSINGFTYFAERDLLPVGHTGGFNTNLNHLPFFSANNKKLLQVLCEVLPVNLLIKYFDGFLDSYEISFIQINESYNTSFTDEVISAAINRQDLRKEISKSKVINLDTFNHGITRQNGVPFGNGLFINYALTVMINYALNHNIDDEIRIELLKSALDVNLKSFTFVSSFYDQELKIDKFGYITNRFNNFYYGSIAIPSKPSVDISNQSKDLLEQLNRQVRDYHELIFNHSMVSVYNNVILAEKKNNPDYYRFFKLMNDSGIKCIPHFEESDSNDHDSFTVSNSEKSRFLSPEINDVKKVLSEIKKIDDVSIKDLHGKTYFLVDPMAYFFENKVNYIMPKDIEVTNKYANLVYFINRYGLQIVFETRSIYRIKYFIELIKSYELPQGEINDFLQDYISLSEAYAQSIVQSDNGLKDQALKILEYKAFVEVYRNDIVKEF